jgi:hypothetical protein
MKLFYWGTYIKIKEENIETSWEYICRNFNKYSITGLGISVAVQQKNVKNYASYIIYSIDSYNRIQAAPNFQLHGVTFLSYLNENLDVLAYIIRKKFTISDCRERDFVRAKYMYLITGKLKWYNAYCLDVCIYSRQKYLLLDGFQITKSCMLIYDVLMQRFECVYK